MLICENLIAARKQKKLSQRDLGEMIGISGTMIGMYEKGTRSPRPAILRQLAEVLGVDVTWLETKEVVNEWSEYKVQFDSVIELVNLLQNPGKERKFLSNFARLSLAFAGLGKNLEEMKNLYAEETTADDELEVLRKVELSAKSCYDCFSEMQEAYPMGYAGVRESFELWQKDKQKFDDLLQEYLKLNKNGRKIIVNTATALAATPDYSRSIEQDVPNTERDGSGGVS